MKSRWLVCGLALGVLGCDETTAGPIGGSGGGGAGGEAGSPTGGTAGDGGVGGDGGSARGVDECADVGASFVPCGSEDGFVCVEGVCRAFDCGCDTDYGTPCVGVEGKGDVFVGSCIGNSCVAGECEDDGDCSDDKDCTSETCLSKGMCESVAVRDGTPCAGGACESGECVLETAVLPCTEQAIRNAVAAGGDEPYRFDCDAAAPVVTESEIYVCGRAVLDGQGALLIDGNAAEVVFEVTQDGSLELRGIGVTNAGSIGISGGPVTLTNSRVTDNDGSGIYGDESVTLTDSTVARNGGVGINLQGGALSVRRSTISGNLEGEIFAFETFAELTDSTVSGNVNGSAITVVNSTLTLTNSTISGDIADDDSAINFSSTLLDGACIHLEVGGTWVSGGYNIESPGDTCGFDQPTDLVVPDPKLGPLADNGGPTQTHALLPGSPAIDRIPVEDCVDADGLPVTEDQCGEPRPAGDGCDVGAFELQP